MAKLVLPAGCTILKVGMLNSFQAKEPNLYTIDQKKISLSQYSSD